MVSLRFLATALLAGIIAATPILNTPTLVENSLVKRDNCTEYCSVSAGCVCRQIPSDCAATYLVQPDDTCSSIASAFSNFTVSIFYYWNPDVGPSCFGLRAYVPVCIDTPWYHFSPPVQKAYGTVEGNNVPTDIPIPQAPGIVANCNKFELAGNGYGVSQIEQQNGITDDQFYAWNTGVNRSAPVTFGGYWYCAGVSS